MTKSKLCKLCKKEKSLHDFNQKQSKCKSCQKKYDNRYYNDNIEKILKYKKQYRNLNKNEISNYLKFYYKKNKPTIQQYNKKYYIESELPLPKGRGFLSKMSKHFHSRHFEIRAVPALIL
jgi:hypothetical protein